MLHITSMDEGKKYTIFTWIGKKVRYIYPYLEIWPFTKYTYRQRGIRLEPQQSEAEN